MWKLLLVVVALLLMLAVADTAQAGPFKVRCAAGTCVAAVTHPVVTVSVLKGKAAAVVKRVEGTAERVVYRARTRTRLAASRILPPYRVRPALR